MAEFYEGKIILTEEEKETFRECGSFISTQPDQRRRKSSIKNLLQALEDNFIGWEVKEKL